LAALSLFFSARGILGRRPFVLAIIPVYLLALASHALTAPHWLARGGLIAFALAQIVLLWSWYALHVKRLRDARHAPAPAIGIALIYLLALVLLVLILAFFMQSAGQALGSSDTLPSSSVLALYLLMFLLGMLASPGSLDMLDVTTAVLALVLASPLLIVTGFTLWAATRPSARVSHSAT
jgi:uncharacterized membrane protein YhaH (DUF805 family)